MFNWFNKDKPAPPVENTDEVIEIPPAPREFVSEPKARIPIIPIDNPLEVIDTGPVGNSPHVYLEDKPGSGRFKYRGVADGPSDNPRRYVAAMGRAGHKVILTNKCIGKVINEELKEI